MSTFHIQNFGCRATQADGAALERQFEDLGLTSADSTKAEVVVLNTCTVTAEADRDARAAIRRVQRQNPNAKIVVTGCYAQRAPQEIAALPGVSAVIGNSHKHQLAEIALANLLADSHEHNREGYDFSRTAKEVKESAASATGWRSASSPAKKKAEESAASAAEGNAFLPLSILTENQKLETRNSIYVSDIFAHTELLAAPVFDAPNSRTRPNLKVQDGCDNRCSFCVIPYVRGQSRSLPLDEILREVEALVASGYRELVISGINLGRWGRDLPQKSCVESLDFRQEPWGDSRPRLSSRAQRDSLPTLESLIRAILDETSIEKLRISSVEPMDWSDDLISLVASSPRIAKHAHVPMQSGSDAVLRRMHRKYRPWHYREKIEKIRAAVPTAAIGADVMVGFPGETDAEFESTRRMIEDLPFTYLHVFTYSARPGTPAAAMRNQVPIHVARERNRILRDLAEEKKQTFMQSFIGQTLDAITLGKSEASSWSDGRLVRPAKQSEARGLCGAGTPACEAPATDSTHESKACTEALTDNYLKLNLEGKHAPNQWLRTRITSAGKGHFTGVVVDDAATRAFGWRSA